MCFPTRIKDYFAKKMSFGGKSFKKQLVKKELQQLTKQSQNEFSSLAAAEKEALRQKTKTNTFDRPKGKKKRQKVDDNFEHAPSPSVDLGPELQDGVELSQTELATEQENDGTYREATHSAKVASIRANVDLQVVMHGKRLDETIDASGPITTARGDTKANQVGFLMS